MAVDVDTFVATRIVFGKHETKPTEPVMLSDRRFRITMPDTKNSEENVAVIIEKKQIVKLICHLDVQPTLVFRVRKECIDNIRKLLHIEQFEYDENWIIIETESMDDAVKNKIKELFSVCDEISHEDIKKFVNLKLKVQEAVVEKKPKVLKKQLSKKKLSVDSIDLANTSKHIVTYPSTGAGAISITVPDFECLAAGEFLNDVIINFYLQYIYLEVLTKQQRLKTHIFNTFFYEALSAKPPIETTRSTGSSIAQLRYERVEKWTKNVNLFTKDFIIVPINQHAHWFLAIICFPGLTDEVSTSTKRKSTKKDTGHIEATAHSSSSNDETIVSNKRPCILIFDSMAGEERKVPTLLRDYLTCAYESKMGKGEDLKFDASNMPGHNVKVPRQANMSDCGLFILQYIEQFFQDPIKDFEIPIKHLENWFDTSVVTQKRRDIVQIIKNQMIRCESRCGMTVDDLPAIKLPPKTED